MQLTYLQDVITLTWGVFIKFAQTPPLWKLHYVDNHSHHLKELSVRTDLRPKADFRVVKDQCQSLAAGYRRWCLLAQKYPEEPERLL